MVAIKDEYAREWSFVNFDDDEESAITPLLFSKQVTDKLKTFK